MTTATTITPISTFSRQPEYLDIPIESLRIDPTYQRDPNAAQFKNMKKWIVGNYDEALFHALDVALWDNNGEGHPTYWVYDGYCRLESAKELQKLGQRKDTVQCAVIRVDQQEQARLFTGQTARRTVQWADKHRARLAYADPTALVIEEVFNNLGLKLGKNGDVRAVQACYSTAEVDRTAATPDADLRPDLLTQVLQVAGTAWATGPGITHDVPWIATDPVALSAGLREQYASSDRMIDALVLLLSKFSPTEMPREKLAAALHQVAPPVLINKAARKTSAHGSNNKGALAAEILSIYNKVNGAKLHKARIVTTARARRVGRAASKK